MEKEDVAIGIDLGTTYCCVAVYQNDEVVIIENDVGSRTTPSYVTIDNGDIYVGEISKQLAHENPEATIFDVKRLIGRKFYDSFVQNDVKLWPFEIVNENLLPKIKVDEVTYFPEEISAKVLEYLKQTAEDYLGHPVTKAVITVPAYFNDGQRRATKQAGKIAGLQVLRIINEPTAAAIAYNLEKDIKDTKNCLIFDLGGGTFDVSVLTMSRGKIDIKAVDGHTHLGGEDFDNAMANYCIAQFKKLHGIDLNEARKIGSEVSQRKAVKAIRRLKAECERQKMFLSSARKVDVSLFALFEGKDLNVAFDQDLFNQLNETKFQLCMDIVESVMESSSLRKDDIMDIVLIGGSSRIPKIQQLLSEKFGGKPLAKGIDPETSVAYGAAIQGFQIVQTNARRVTITDVVHLPIGIEYDRLREGDPNFAVVVPKNSPIPCRFSNRYQTVRDNQERIKINIFEGEGLTTEENHLLGNFEVTNLPQCPQGELVEVSLEVDSDGILRVTATLPAHSVGNKITVREYKGILNEDFSNLGMSMRNMQITTDVKPQISREDAVISSTDTNTDSPLIQKVFDDHTKKIDGPLNNEKIHRQSSVSSADSLSLSKGKDKDKDKKFKKTISTLSKAFGKQTKKLSAFNLFHKSDGESSMMTTCTNSNLPIINLGIHIDHNSVSVGVYNNEEHGKFDIVLEESGPSVVILEDRIIKGMEAVKDYKDHPNFFTFYRLLTIKATKIHEFFCREKIKLRNEEVLAAFLIDMKRFVENLKQVTVENVAFSLSFLTTSDQKERLKAAATLAGFRDVRIVSSLLATVIAIAKDDEFSSTTVATTQSKFTFVMQYDKYSFSSAIIEIQQGGTSITTWASFTSETLSVDMKAAFLRAHVNLIQDGLGGGREDEKVAKLVYDDIIKRCEKQAGNVTVKDYVVVNGSEQTSVFSGIDTILMGILNHKLKKLNFKEGPLKGVAILAASMDNLLSNRQSLQTMFQTNSLNVRDVSHFNLRLIVGDTAFEHETELQNAFSDRLVFSQEVSVPKMRPCLISLKQVSPSGLVYDVCEFLLSIPTKLKEGPVATIDCHLDQDGIYSLNDIPSHGVSVQFVRTDRFLLDIEAAKGADSNFKKFIFNYFDNSTTTTTSQRPSREFNSNF